MADADQVPLVLVAAVAENGVIGRSGGLPWRLASDLKHFRRVTMGHPVVMGRRTFQSLTRPLRGRTNIVVSRDPTFAAAGAIVTPRLSCALDVAAGDARRRGVAAIMIIGGGELYRQTLDRAARLEITRVNLSPEGDAWFPAIDPQEWREVSRQAHDAGRDDDAAFTTLTYLRMTG